MKQGTIVSIFMLVAVCHFIPLFLLYFTSTSYSQWSNPTALVMYSASPPFASGTATLVAEAVSFIQVFALDACAIALSFIGVLSYAYYLTVTDYDIKYNKFPNSNPMEMVTDPESGVTRCQNALHQCFATTGRSLGPHYAQEHKFTTVPLFFIIENGITKGTIYMAMAAMAGIPYVYSYVYLFFIPMVLMLILALPRKTMHMWLRVLIVAILYTLMIAEIMKFMTAPLIAVRFWPNLIIMILSAFDIFFSMDVKTLFMLTITTFLQVWMLTVPFYGT
jgi:hypothetical protein